MVSTETRYRLDSLSLNAGMERRFFFSFSSSKDPKSLLLK